MSDSPPFIRLHSGALRPILRAVLFPQTAGIRCYDSRRTRAMGVCRERCRAITVTQRKQEAAPDGGSVVETDDSKGVITSNFECLISNWFPECGFVHSSNF